MKNSQPVKSAQGERERELVLTLNILHLKCFHIKHFTQQMFGCFDRGSGGVKINGAKDGHLSFIAAILLQ